MFKNKKQTLKQMFIRELCGFYAFFDAPYFFEKSAVGAYLVCFLGESKLFGRAV